VSSFIRGRRAQVAAHRLAVDVQRPADRGGADTGGMQGVDLGVPLPGHLGPAARLTLDRRARLRDGLGLGPILEAGAMGTHDPIDRLGEVLQQVETVGDLDRVRRPLPGAL
jgi:hypothetical protein